MPAATRKKSPQRLAKTTSNRYRGKQTGTSNSLGFPVR